MKAPKPAGRPGRVPIWTHIALFRRDILSSQPERLYAARMAEFRTPFFRSFLVNEPDLVKTVLCERPMDFPKSGRVGEGLRPLLGNSVFVTNGAEWERQRRIIDPAFEGGRLRQAFPAILGAATAGADHLSDGLHEIEERTSHMAADAIFRTLFSVPIEAPLAAEVYRQFRVYQRAQPIVNLAAFVPLPRWVPRIHPRAAVRAAASIRGLVAQLVAKRDAEIRAGTAPDDLATKIMTTADPVTGACFSPEEMVDQVAIFFLAGHETSASALSWALYLLATHPEVQDRAAVEAQAFMASPDVGAAGRLAVVRAVFREALRLYPPVPMMVREAACPESFRDRPVSPGAQVIVSPWHLHRSPRYWDRPDDFDPDRWLVPERRDCPREAFLPFSAGARVCPGAGFAMIEGPVFLASLLARWRFAPVPGRVPMPVAHLTVRSREGILLGVEARANRPEIRQAASDATSRAVAAVPHAHGTSQAAARP